MMQPTDSQPDDAYTVRAAAHAAPDTALRAPQRFGYGVTDLDVARLMLTLERGPGLSYEGSTRRRWVGAPGSPMRGPLVHATVAEAVRTGLLRDYRDPATGKRTLIPAKVHLDLGEHVSACLFTGEDLGPMRSRLVGRLELVDCLDCERVVSTGTVRGL